MHDCKSHDGRSGPTAEARRWDWRGHLRSISIRYGGALLAIAIATLLRWWLNPVLEGAGIAIYVATVIIVAWFGRLGPCLLAQVLSIVLTAALFSNPAPQPEPPIRVLFVLSVFSFAGIATALLSESTRRAERRARARADDALRQREQLETTLSCIGDAVIVTDNSGHLTLINPVAQRLAGRTAGESLGRSLLEVFHIASEGSHEPAESPVDRVLREGRADFRIHPAMLIAPDDSRLPIEYSAAPVRDADGHISGVVLTFRDVSERRRAENALHEADRRKDEFLALLAHELRNPLAPIGNALQILAIAPDDRQMSEDARAMMQRQFEHLVRLVDDLLDVSRISRGKLELRPEASELDAIVQRAVEAARPLMVAQGHTFVLDVRSPPPLLLVADPVRLAQVFTNLLTNAAKYTPPGGTITLAAHGEETHVVVSVRDTGVGISSEMLPRIFEMFMQVDRGQNREHGGLGLGLTLVKSVVEMHGGRVEAHSAGLGQGSEFTVHLPLSSQLDAGGDAESPFDAWAPATNGRKILVVDDNVDSANTLACLLQANKHEVQVAHDGPAALATVEIARPEIVILDIGMPGMDGYEVAERLRARPQGEQLVLVALTGWGGPEDRRRTQAAGFDYHFVKPVKPDDLHRVTSQASPSAVGAAG